MIKSIYSYSEDEFVELNNTEIEQIILKLIKLKKDKNYKNYYKYILKKFEDNDFPDKKSRTSLFHALFDDKPFRTYLKKNPNPNSLFRRYKKVVKGQIFFSIFISFAIGVIAGMGYSFFNYLLTILGWGIIGSVVVFLFLQIFLLPSNIAHIRQHPEKSIILLINLFGGGFGLPWFIVLYWAAKDFK